uniref:Uncharacterized protein n=1 Tax=Trichobilharzia regenti TaxID=157069 RepID=A0AA85J4L3_TRIRE|nr:unnamed protein product [Trichobilharzia regenti]
MVAQSEMTTLKLLQNNSTTVKMERTEGRQALFHMEHCIKDTVGFLSKHIPFLLMKNDPHEIFNSKWNYVAIALIQKAQCFSLEPFPNPVFLMCLEEESTNHFNSFSSH